ncbi:hypothetical protein E4U54_006634, partial [Claviceps lovelessii]
MTLQTLTPEVRSRLRRCRWLTGPGAPLRGYQEGVWKLASPDAHAHHEKPEGIGTSTCSYAASASRKQRQ